MLIGRRFVAVILGLGVLSFCSACKHHGEGAENTVTVNLSVNGNNCVQSQGGNAVNYVPVNSGETVTWTAPNAGSSCTIHFDNNAGACPFYSAAANQCDYTCTNGTVTSKPANGTVGTQYPYGSWQVGGTNCPVGQDGLIMR
jgi:hypothetical protein